MKIILLLISLLLLIAQVNAIFGDNNIEATFGKCPCEGAKVCCSFTDKLDKAEKYCMTEDQQDEKKKGKWTADNGQKYTYVCDKLVSEEFKSSDDEDKKSEDPGKELAKIFDKANERSVHAIDLPPKM